MVDPFPLLALPAWTTFTSDRAPASSRGAACPVLSVLTGKELKELDIHFVRASRKRKPLVRARAPLAPTWDFQWLQRGKMAADEGQAARLRGWDRKPATGFRPILYRMLLRISGREVRTLSWETAAGRRGCRAPSAGPLLANPLDMRNRRTRLSLKSKGGRHPGRCGAAQGRLASRGDRRPRVGTNEMRLPVVEKVVYTNGPCFGCRSTVRDWHRVYIQTPVLTA